MRILHSYRYRFPRLLQTGYSYMACRMRHFFFQLNPLHPPTWTYWFVREWCRCQFKVGSACEPAKNQFAFSHSEVVREPRHCVTAYVFAFRNCSAAFITVTMAEYKRLQLLLLALRGFTDIQTRLTLCEILMWMAFDCIFTNERFYKYNLSEAV